VRCWTSPTVRPVAEPRRLWSAAVIEGVANVLGDTDLGLSGTEITRLLASTKVADVSPAASKRHRLRDALKAHQASARDSRRLLTVVTQALDPPGYVNRTHEFTRRQDAINEHLVFVGLRIMDDGRAGHAPPATTLSDAARHASSLQAELRRRTTHQQVLASCTLEVLAKDAFHASSEAIKGVLHRVRDLSGHRADGAELVDATLAGTAPTIAINSGRTKSEQSEQAGFATLVKGVAMMYRNPLAHDPRTQRTVTDDELLELLTTLSMVHRRLDTALMRPPSPD
jgi:uncharacterized protein (TIGR02391 family)